MGSHRGLDKFVIGRLLEAVLKANGLEAESAISGAANLNDDTYDEYRDILLATRDITMSTRATDKRSVPKITTLGMDTLRECRKDVARYGKENLVVEGIRADHAEKRRKRREPKTEDRTLGEESA